MDDGGDCGDVDEAMETPPGFAAHGPENELGRSGGKEEEEEPGEEAYLDEAALSEIFPDGGPDELELGEELGGVAVAGGGEGGGEVVAGEEEEVGEEVEGSVKEGVQADHAAEADEGSKCG